ncbi:MAG: hypothetical protein ACI90G_002395, partial [Urechidicola sp.]
APHQRGYRSSLDNNIDILKYMTTGVGLIEFDHSKEWTIAC